MPILLIFSTFSAILVRQQLFTVAQNAQYLSLASATARQRQNVVVNVDDKDDDDDEDAAAAARVEHYEHDVSDDVNLKGDIVLGGLFPVHEDGSPRGRHCGPIKPDKGIQRMEAMLFALEEINRAGTLFPGLVLGAQILDTCNQDTHGLEQTLKFIKSSLSQENVAYYQCMDNRPVINHSPKPVPAVIGAASSQVSAMVANVLRLFKIPQISYSSTSSELSDKARFTYFSRVVPPDDLQAEAMADIVKSLGWTYVSTVFDEGSYGEQGMEAFSKYASQRNICIATSQKIKRDFKKEDYVSLVQELRKQRGRGVIVFVNEDNIKKMLKVVHNLNFDSYFAWVASDNWGNKRSAVQDNSQSAIGAITIQPKMRPDKGQKSGFDQYFKKLNPATRKVKYKYFDEFWKHTFNCSELDSQCLANSLAHKHVQESYVPFVVDVVYLAAHALSRYMRDHCHRPRMKNCKDLKIDGKKLLQYIRSTSFAQGSHDEVRLNENGDRMIRYIIYQYRGFREQYLPVGEWISRGLTLNASLIKSGYPHGRVPDSKCGRRCLSNEYKSSTHSVCCWICLVCNESSIKPDETLCINCDLGWRPNSYKNECVPMVPDALAWTSPFALVPVCVAVMGIVATIFTFIVFTKHHKTPVIMASGRELCYIMLVGIFFCFLMTFAILHTPSQVSCGMLRMGLALCLSIIYAAILTKTSRLSRIFTKNVRALQRPRLISPKAQVVICSLLVSVQVLGSVSWLIHTPPKTTLRFTLDRLTMIVSCDVAPRHMLASFSYIALLITLCTWYAFKTRKIPENFNETKHIGFTMYATCIIWLSFGPIYFGTENNFRVLQHSLQHSVCLFMVRHVAICIIFQIQVCSLCMCLSLSGTVALCCVFAPKIYIVLLQPEKNKRRNKSGLQKMQVNMVNQQMRFLSKPPAVFPTYNSVLNSSMKDTTKSASPTKISSDEVIANGETDVLLHRKKQSSDNDELSNTSLIIENPKANNSTPIHPRLSPVERNLAAKQKPSTSSHILSDRCDRDLTSAKTSNVGDPPFSAKPGPLIPADVRKTNEALNKNRNKRDSAKNYTTSRTRRDRVSFKRECDYSDICDVVRPDSTVSSRTGSPDSYTEPVRLGPKPPKSVTLPTFTADGLHRRSSDRPDEEPLLRRMPEVHQTNRRGQYPMQREWILLDPQTEFETIISDISRQKATFV